jgi:hypothetical protein
VAERYRRGVTSRIDRTNHLPGPIDVTKPWKEMNQPVPEQASAVFQGVDRTKDRLQRLVDEVDAFYRRGALRLPAAHADRHLIPDLDPLLRAVEAGVSALVREAVNDETLQTAVLQLVVARWIFQCGPRFRRSPSATRIGDGTWPVCSAAPSAPRGDRSRRFARSASRVPRAVRAIRSAIRDNTVDLVSVLRHGEWSTCSLACGPHPGHSAANSRP